MTILHTVSALRKYCYSKFTPQCFLECPFYIEGLSSKKAEILRKSSIEECLEWLDRAVPMGLAEPIKWEPKNRKSKSKSEPAPAPAPEPEPEPEPELKPLFKPKYEESSELEALLSQLQQRVMGHYIDLCRSNEIISPEILSIAFDTRIELENYAIEKCRIGPVNPSRLGALKCKFINQLKDSPVPNLHHPGGFSWRDYLNQFDDLLRKAFSDVTRAKYVKNRELNQAAIQDVREIEILPLLEWAVDRLELLPPFPSGDVRKDKHHGAEWVGVAIALMLVTGRRQSEILSSGEFYPSDSPKKAFFEGQLKRHTDDPIEAYEIPLLCNFKLVADGMKWLKSYGKRVIPDSRDPDSFRRAALISNHNWGGRISRGWRQLQDLVPILNGKEWQTIAKNHFKPHLSRQIYAEMAYLLHSQANFKKRYFVASILGEGSALAGLPYDRDIAIADEEQCLDFLNSLK